MLDRTVLLLFMMVLVLGISYGMHTYSLTAFLKTDVGAEYNDLATLGVAKFLPYVIIPIFIGVLLNRIPAAKIMIVGVVMHSVPLFMISVSESVVEVILFQVVLGASHGFLWPPVNSIFSHNSRTRVKNIARATMFFMLGLMIGPLMGMGILDMTDDNYRLVFQIGASVMASGSIMAVLLHAGLPRTKIQPPNPKSFAGILHFPVVIALVFFTTAVSGILFVIYPAYLVDNGISATSMMFLFFIYGAIRVGSLWIVNYMHRWMLPILATCIVTTTGGLALSFFGTSFVHFALAMCMMAFAIIAYPICLEVILARTKRSVANKMVGAYASLVGFGWFLGPVIAGNIAHWFDPSTPYLVFCIVGVGMVVAAATLRKTLAFVEARHKTASLVNHTLKDHLNTAILNLGLMNMALARAKTYEDIPSKIHSQYAQMTRILGDMRKTLETGADAMDEGLAEEVEAILDYIENADLPSGVGKGYPEYQKIKERISVCVEHLNEAMNVDIVVDVRNWLNLQTKR